MVLEGSPEHQLLKEAKVIWTEEGNSPQLKEAGLGEDSRSEDRKGRKATASEVRTRKEEKEEK